MITSLHLGNFKAFGDPQDIPIKPITLIFGANSAGKSSIIHSLALAHEAMRTGELDLFRTNLGGSSIDLGGFRQYIHQRQAGYRMTWGLTLSTSKFTGRLKELFQPVEHIALNITTGMPLDDQGQPLPGALPHVISYELESDGSTLLRMSRRPGNQMALDLLPFKHPVLQQLIRALLSWSTTTSEISETDLENLEKPIAEIISNLRGPIGALFPERLKDKNTEDESGQQVSLFPVSQGNREEDLSKAVRFFLPRTLDELIQELNKTVEKEIKRLQYLGPLRSYPARHLAFTEHEDTNWYAGGGYAWDIVRRNKEIRDKVNVWLNDPQRLSTPYELTIRNLITLDDIESDHYQLVNDVETGFVSGESDDPFGELYDIPNRLEEMAEKYASFQELVLLDRRTNTQVSHRDVGIGVSQVLPVLVSSYVGQNKIIAIEQPEIHLHPALQAELGDVFIESALAGNNNTFLLETHSEHLILRIMRRIRDTYKNKNTDIPITNKDVAVLYVTSGKNGSQVINIPISADGDFEEEWPDGFFEEREKELFD